MKTALSVLSLLALTSAGAVAQDRPSSIGEVYAVELDELGACEVDFQSYVLGGDRGDISMLCDNGDSTRGMWTFTHGGDLYIHIEPLGEPALWGDGCLEWPIIEEGETVMDPCWMSSLRGGPVQVTRTR
ncbi:hypothetical protein ACFELO_02120 [Oceanicaulis sp. LC35]|uniref:hypothetical protein n=1 Tax=Oceanicaulis sp. LC35 TaxID=3349635 RepID=UPI003F855308